ncbi:formyl transferase, partial [Campylobacter sp. TTU-622]|nr:formyl transferase [Campylobacter sp. TTU-622]
MEYENIFIIGDGKVAKECQKIAQNFFQQEVKFIENKTKNYLDNFFNSLKYSLI